MIDILLRQQMIQMFDYMKREPVDYCIRSQVES